MTKEKNEQVFLKIGLMVRHEVIKKTVIFIEMQKNPKGLLVYQKLTRSIYGHEDAIDYARIMARFIEAIYPIVNNKQPIVEKIASV